jgi:hypothetical protein
MKNLAMDLRRIVLLGHNGFVGCFDRDDPWNIFSRVSLEDLLDTMRDGETLDPYVILKRDGCQKLGFRCCEFGAGSC